MNARDSQDVLVTGLGVVTPLGVGIEPTWQRLLNRQSGAGPITRFDPEEHPLRSQVAGEVTADFGDHPRVNERATGRFARLTLVAASEALDDAGLSPSDEDWVPERVGVSVGSTIGGVPEYETGHQRVAEGDRVSPRLITRFIPNLATGHVSIEFNIQGPNRAPATACAAGSYAIADGVADIRTGRADIVVAGGTETALTPTAMRGFDAMRALSTHNNEPSEASRPFDADRDGFVAAEGAGIVILEAAEHAATRGVGGYATVAGTGLSGDATHETRPPEDASGLRHAIRQALTDAGVSRSAVDLINAHGTATPVGDAHEARAIHEVWGEETPPVWAPKGALGHTLGASGAIDAALTARALQSGTVPPTLNHDRCDLDHPPTVITETNDLDPRVVVSNSAGFGGTNASLVLRASERADGGSLDVDTPQNTGHSETSVSNEHE